MKLSKKLIVLLMSVMLIVGATVGGTLAWIVTQTTPIVNTFTVGDINIELNETTTDYKMVPGTKIAKDPMVTIKAGSEACWLFVKIEESANFENFIEPYTIAAGWHELTGGSGVYYREEAGRLDSNNSDITHQVLEGITDYESGYVTVKSEVTKADLESIKNNPAIAPTLTFTAYAVQMSGFPTAADAWVEITKSVEPPIT